MTRRNKPPNQLERQNPKGNHGGAVIKASRSLTYTSSGPLPPSYEFEDYDRILPGAAERILKMAEKQNEHRIEMEAIVVRGSAAREQSGMIIGAILLVLGFVTAGVCSYLGDTTTASIIGGATIGSILGAYVVGAWSRKSERQGSAKDAEKPVD